MRKGPIGWQHCTHGLDLVGKINNNSLMPARSLVSILISYIGHCNINTMSFFFQHWCNFGVNNNFLLSVVSCHKIYWVYYNIYIMWFCVVSRYIYYVRWLCKMMQKSIHMHHKWSYCALQPLLFFVVDLIYNAFAVQLLLCVMCIVYTKMYVILQLWATCAHFLLDAFLFSAFVLLSFHLLFKRIWKALRRVEVCVICLNRLENNTTALTRDVRKMNWIRWRCFNIAMCSKCRAVIQTWSSISPRWICVRSHIIIHFIWLT